MNAFRQGEVGVSVQVGGGGVRDVGLSIRADSLLQELEKPEKLRLWCSFGLSLGLRNGFDDSFSSRTPISLLSLG